MRRFMAPVIISTTFAVTLLLAPPSTAATIPVTNANCTSFSPPRSIVAAPGDLVDISANLTGCRAVSVNKSIVSVQSDIVVTSASSVTVLDQGSSWFFDSGIGNQISRVQITLGSTLGTTSTAIRVTESAGPIATQWTVTISAGGGGGGSSDSTTSSSTPNPILQQFGKPSSSTCDATAPESLNWSGVASGGWGESWAEWMNGGNGGAVCTRTLVYSNALGGWTVS